MKVAVTGKGGVGKTSVSALLARRLADLGRRVLAVDGDPDTNLAAALGFSRPDEIVPIAEMKDLVFQRMGTSPGTVGTYFKLNPKVDDIPERFVRSEDGVRLIVMGQVTRGGAGCACPENAFLKALLSHLMLGPDEDIVVDMEAGLEHLGRGTAASTDGLIVVVEPSLNSIDTLRRVAKLAGDIGVRCLWPLANRVAGEEDRAFLTEHTAEFEFVGWLPCSDGIVRANRGQASIRDAEPPVWEVVDHVIEELQKAVGVPPAADRIETKGCV